LHRDGALWAEEGKVTLKSNTNDALTNDFFSKNNADKALRDDFC
jgi:hypothetical protein